MAHTQTRLLILANDDGLRENLFKHLNEYLTNFPLENF